MSKANGAPLTRAEFLEAMEGINKRFDGIDKRFDGLDARFDGIDKQLDGMDSRFDRIDKTLRLIAKSQTWILEVLVTQDNQLTESRLAELSKH